MIPFKDQHTLTDDEIADIILKYIDEDIYNYAVMIDGEWGCGKTYFINGSPNSLINKLEKHENDKKAEDENYKPRQVIYMSLYGIKSTSEISKHILMESYLSKTGKAKGVMKKGAKAVGAILPTAFDLINNKYNINLDAKNISDSIEGILSIKESILIFDDLERCDCPINEILGFINSFVEQEGLKVILVANQKEIGRSTYQANQELKYLVAAHPNIIFSDKSVDKSTQTYSPDSKQNNQDGEKAVQADLNTIRDRIDRLFGQNTSYAQIKEKLVGQTIYYYPNLQETFEKLITRSNLEKDLQARLIKDIAFFESCMINEEHPNLRTFQFFLSKIKELYGIINQIEATDEDRETFLNYITGYCFRICVSYKSGTYKYTWSKNEEYEQKAIGKVDIFGTSLNFRFIDDLVVNSILDKDRAESMLKVYIGMYNKQENIETKSLNLIQYEWSTSTDNEIEEAIGVVLQGLKDNKYKMTTYSPIIGSLLILEDVGFDAVYLQEAISLMKGNIDQLTYHIGIDTGYGMDGTATDTGRRHKKIIEELQGYVDEHLRQHVATQIGQLISTEDKWAGRLVDYLKNNQFEVIHTIGFLSQVDINELIDKLANSTSYDINAFRICINSIYKENSIGAALSQEGHMLADLIKGIKQLDTSTYDKVKTLQTNYLIKNLKTAYSLYSNDDVEKAEKTESEAEEINT